MKSLPRIITLLVLLSTTRAWTQGVFKIKNHSSFNSVDLARNPFWPIGYVPGSQTPNIAQATPQKALLKAEDFNLTSISSFGGTRMGMLNGKPVGEGEMVNINVGGQRIKVQTVKVSDGAVVIRYMGQDITVILKRPELDLMNKPASKEPVLHSSEE